jgi:hypothetical protein
VVQAGKQEFQESREGNTMLIGSRGFPTFNSIIFIITIFATQDLGLAAKCVKPAAGLVSWWTADGNANDAVGTNHGTLRNGAMATAAGKVSQGFNLNGVDAFIEIPHTPSLQPGTSSFSIDAWIKTTQGTGEADIVSQYECGLTCISFVSNSLYILSMINGTLDAKLRDSNASAIQLTGNTYVADGTFHHVAMVRDMVAMEFRLYVDGRADARTPLTGATGPIKDDDGENDPVLIGASFHAGSSAKNAFFQGIIDEVEFYNVALRDNDVADIFSANIPRRLVSW